MGFGRVGSTIAHSLENFGHSVAVVDQSAEAFRRLGPDFAGRTITGVGFDRDTLIEAGIEEADAFAVGFMLPKWLVVGHCARQGWRIADLLRPEVVYQLSLRLGASYEATCRALRIP